MRLLSCNKKTLHIILWQAVENETCFLNSLWRNKQTQNLLAKLLTVPQILSESFHMNNYNNLLLLKNLKLLDAEEEEEEEAEEGKKQLKKKKKSSV